MIIIEKELMAVDETKTVFQLLVPLKKSSPQIRGRNLKKRCTKKEITVVTCDSETDKSGAY